jgi:crotonobetainyl-CoA:carnitine CoA-transferase CaiB-like acyl-CoA transferase
LLGDLGAEVVKVERPGVGDVNRHWDTAVEGTSSAHTWVDRNKRSIELDLKSDTGREIAMDLAAKADVITQNFSPGVVDRLDIGYDDISDENEDVVYLNISGYGRTGPYRDRRAYDLVMQGETGLILLTGLPDSPAKIPLSVCDINAGMYGAMAILTALFHRERTGVGQEIDVDMFSGILSWLGYFPIRYLHDDKTPERVGMRHHLLTPYGPFPTGDDQYLNFAILSEAHWEIFCHSIVDRPEWVEDERFETNEKRVQNRETLEQAIKNIFTTKTRDEWVALLDEHGIPWGDVNSIPEVLSHPVVEERDLLTTVETENGPIKVVDHPIDFGENETRQERMPGLGEHTEQILSELGHSEADIERLRSEGVI